MQYLRGDEIALFAPPVADDDEIADDTGQTRYILDACSTVDGALGRTLEIVAYYDEEIKLDQNFTGRLRNRPFVAWVGSTGTSFYFGHESSGQQLDLADFNVDRRSGVIRNLSRRPWVFEDPGFMPRSSYADSPYRSSHSQYHVRNSQVFHDNSKPFVMRASYRAGWFAEQVVETSGAVGATAVTLIDVSGLERGREFYFSTDPVNQPLVDRRITNVDTATRVVTFSPAVNYVIPAATLFRMVDKVVRSAVADIIADTLTYPPNTRVFSETLGRGDLQNQWVRMNGVLLPVRAAHKLAKYQK